MTLLLLGVFQVHFHPGLQVHHWPSHLWLVEILGQHRIPVDDQVLGHNQVLLDILGHLWLNDQVLVDILGQHRIPVDEQVLGHNHQVLGHHRVLLDILGHLWRNDWTPVDILGHNQVLGHSRALLLVLGHLYVHNLVLEGHNLVDILGDVVLLSHVWVTNSVRPAYAVVHLRIVSNLPKNMQTYQIAGKNFKTFKKMGHPIAHSDRSIDHCFAIFL